MRLTDAQPEDGVDALIQATRAAGIDVTVEPSSTPRLEATIEAPDGRMLTLT